MEKVRKNAKTYIQIRSDVADKEKAVQILDSLGLNLSTVFNILLKQIIITKGIPFEIKLNQEVAYSNDESASEIAATLAMEGMHMTEEDYKVLAEYQNGDDVQREAMRTNIINKYKEA